MTDETIDTYFDILRVGYFGLVGDILLAFITELSFERIEDVVEL